MLQIWIIVICEYHLKYMWVSFKLLICVYGVYEYIKVSNCNYSFVTAIWTFLNAYIFTYSFLDHLIMIYPDIIISLFCTLIIRPRRSRSAAAYSHQTFPCTICRSVCLSVYLSVCLSSALWKNGRSQPAAVRHHRSDGSTDEAGIGVWQSVHWKGYFWGRIWTAPL